MPDHLAEATLGSVNSHAAGHGFLNDTTKVGPRVLRPLLRVAGIGPEPDSAKDAWDRIELFFATHLN